MIFDTEHCSLVLDAPDMIVDIIKFVNDGILNQERIKQLAGVSVDILGFEMTRTVRDGNEGAIDLRYLGGSQNMLTGLRYFSRRSRDCIDG